MTASTFNLIDQPWIPCICADGRVEELGLAETLLKAHTLRGLAGESPPVTAAIYRLLLAVLYRALDPPEELDEWGIHWEAGRWPEAPLNEYLSRWRPRFDLFHPDHPFYQWRSANSTEKSMNLLIFHIASGNNPTLFDHHTDDEQLVLTPAEAIRALLAVQAFSPAGVGGMAPKDSSNAPWANSIVFLGEGYNLFQTLAFNWMDPAVMGLPTGRDDRPIWEADDPTKPRRGTPLGITDYLTWPNRAIRLIPETLDGQVVIRSAEMGSGLKLTTDIRDPFKHYRITKTAGFRPMQFSENRALWRDSATLLRFRTEDQGHPPRVFLWLADLLEAELLEAAATYRFMALGMASNKARIDFYREEHVPLPVRYLQQENLVDHLRNAITLAENVCSTLMRAVARLATLLLAPSADEPNGRSPDKKDVDNLLAHWAAERTYWAELEPAFFALLETLPQSPNEAMQQWVAALQEQAERAFAQAERAAPNDARGLRATVRARGQFLGALKKTLPSYMELEVTHVAK